MPLFSREKPKTKANAQEPEPQPLDPIALCLALWLGSMVCTFGMVRLMNDAAAARHNAGGAPFQMTKPAPPIYPMAASN